MTPLIQPRAFFLRHSETIRPLFFPRHDPPEEGIETRPRVASSSLTHRSFVYDSPGNLSTYSKGARTYMFHELIFNPRTKTTAVGNRDTSVLSSPHDSHLQPYSSASVSASAPSSVSVSVSVSPPPSAEQYRRELVRLIESHARSVTEDPRMDKYMKHYRIILTRCLEDATRELQQVMMSGDMKKD